MCKYDWLSIYKQIEYNDKFCKKKTIYDFINMKNFIFKLRTNKSNYNLRKEN